MTAPNIEMIANSLRNCSLNYHNAPASPSSPSSSSSSTSSSSYPADSAAAAPPPQLSMAGGLTVELNSEVALPFHWEQCLDIRSGQVYYINWEDGTRTTVDPRIREPSILSYVYSSDDEGPETDLEEEVEAEAEVVVQETYNYDLSSDTDSCSGINTESSYTSNHSSTLSSFSPTESSSSGGFGTLSGASNGAVNGGGAVLVAAGCKACFMYFMVPKHVNVCPKCGGAGLLHLGRA